jgi:hypothetical protein
MTNPTLSCATFADTLADFLERSVDETTRARMEAHALSCDDCGPLLADLRSLRIDAANLPELTPSRDLWAGIASRIETPVVELTPTTGGTAKGWNGATRSVGRVWLGLAAAGLVAVTAAITHEMTKRAITATAPRVAVVRPVSSGDTTTHSPITATAQVATAKDRLPSGNRSTVQPVQPVQPAQPAATTRFASARPSAEQTYDSEIARLRIVVNRRRGQLDSTTVATLEKNLKVIDEAIAQCKQALRKDPASGFLMESLNDAMDNKVQLLRTAASLPSRM